jgi:DNA-binding transcriptional MerR regulator
MEYSDFGFEIFSMSADAQIHSLGGSPKQESMSLNNLYSLNSFHNSGKLSFSYAEYYSGMLEYFQSSYIIKNYEKSSLGISFLHKKIDNIPNTIDAWDNIGEIISENQIDYSNIHYYDDQQIAVLFIYSFTTRVGDVGLKIKPIYTSILNHNAFGISLDIGINRRINDSYNTGISIKNLYSLNQWDTGKIFSVYPQINISNSLKYKSFLFLNEFSSSVNFKSESSNFDIKFGLEISVSKNFKMRTGYSNNQSFSFGFGFDYNDVSYSYSYSPNFHDIILGHNHQFSILLDLSKIKL